MVQVRNIFFILLGLLVSNIGHAVETKSELLGKNYDEIRAFFYETTKAPMTIEKRQSREILTKADKKLKESYQFRSRGQVTLMSSFCVGQAKSILVERLVELGYLVDDSSDSEL